MGQQSPTRRALRKPRREVVDPVYDVCTCDLCAAVAGGRGLVLHPVIVEFQELIDSEPVVRMYLERMIEPHLADPPLVRVHARIATAN